MDDPRIERALARALELGEHGIQVAAYVGEELIVDACAGAADCSGRPVQPYPTSSPAPGTPTSR
jgi:hypothetical protein